MRKLDRRTLMATGTTLAAGGLLGSTATGQEDDDPEDEEPQDVEFEYEYELAANAEGDDADVEERVKLSSGEYYRDGDFCNVEFEVENLTDDKDLTIYINAVVDGNPTHESQSSPEPGESESASLSVIDGCPDDPDLVQITAWVPYIEDSDGDDENGDEEPEDDEPGDEEPADEEPDEPEEEEPEDDSDGDSADEPEEDDEPVDDFAAANISLSVRAPDSISRGESACFEVIVRNEWDETAEISITLDIASTGDGTVAEIEPGDCYSSFHVVDCSELSAGENEWFVTTGGESESGTLILE